jgi:hypothetical protein
LAHVRSVRVLAIIGVLAACGDGKSEEECRAEAAALSGLLVEAAAEPAPLIRIADHVRLVARADLPVRRDLNTGPQVALGPAQIAVGEEVVPDLAGLTGRLRDGFAELQDGLATGRVKPAWVPEPRLVYFLIDPATPWERVVAAVAAAADAGLSAPAFVFEQPPALKPPPRSAIDDQLDALTRTDPSERATELANLTKDLIGDCQALERAFGAVGGVDGADKATTLARAIEPALVECKCKVKIPDLRSVMFRIIYVPRPARVISFAPDAAEQRIELPRATPWSEASERFTPTTSNAELVAR